MLKVVAEREHYLLVSDGRCFTVVERRAGKYYPLRNGIRQGFDPNDDAVPELFRQSVLLSEGDARRVLTHVANHWRDLLEHVR